LEADADLGGALSDQGTKRPNQELLELRQLAQLGRQPFELIVDDLEHTLEVRSRSN
jgi:hypothetical protein